MFAQTSTGRYLLVVLATASDGRDYVSAVLGVPDTHRPHRRPRDARRRNAGLAVDSRRRIYRECRSGYRVSPTGSNVAGALKIGPAAWVSLGPVRVIFSPLAGTPALERNLCEVWLFIDETGVRATAVRWA